MKIASLKTIKNNKKTRFNYAYRAIERDSMSGDKNLEAKADEAMDRLFKHEMNKNEMIDWAIREQEFKMLN